MKDRDTFISENMGLVNYAIKRFLNRGHEYDDIFQIGCMGLIKATDKFDTSRGIKFSTYAVPMIQGEIKRFLRDDMPIHISRDSKTKYQKLHYQIEALKKSQNLSPTEIASQLGYTIEEISELYKTNQIPRSLNQTVYTDKKDNRPIELQETVAGHCNVEKQAVDNICIQQFISSLGGVDGKVIKLRLQEKTQMQIASILHIGQVQVSRILKRTGKKYKEEFNMSSKKPEVIKLIKEGLTNKEIAKKIKVPSTTAAVYRTRFNKNIRAKAQALVNQGKNYKEVSSLLNIDYDLLLTICEVTKVKPKTSKEEIFKMFNIGKTMKQIHISTKETLEQLQKYRNEWASKSFASNENSSKKISPKETPKKEKINIKEEIRKNIESGVKNMNENADVLKGNGVKGGVLHFEAHEPTKHILKATNYAGAIMQYGINAENIYIKPIDHKGQMVTTPNNGTVMGISKDNLHLLIEELKELEEVL